MDEQIRVGRKQKILSMNDLNQMINESMAANKVSNLIIIVTS